MPKVDQKRNRHVWKDWCFQHETIEAEAYPTKGTGNVLTFRVEKHDSLLHMYASQKLRIQGGVGPSASYKCGPWHAMLHLAVHMARLLKFIITDGHQPNHPAVAYQDHSIFVSWISVRHCGHVHVCMFVWFCLYCSLCVWYSVDHSRVPSHHLHLCRSHESRRCLYEFGIESNGLKREALTWRHDMPTKNRPANKEADQRPGSWDCQINHDKPHHADSFKKRCYQSTFDRFSVGCIIFGFCVFCFCQCEELCFVSDGTGSATKNWVGKAELAVCQQFGCFLLGRWIM